jgi:hypothetical protein
MRVRHSFICVLPRSSTCSHIISKTACFSGKSYWTQNMCFDFLYNICPKHFSFQEELSEYVQKCILVFMYSTRYCCQIIMRHKVSLTDFPKVLKYQISWKSVQREPSYSTRTNGRTDRCTDITKLIIPFRNYANAAKNCAFFPQCIYVFCIYLRTATSALYNINWLVFITEMKSVYSAVRSGSLNTTIYASSLKD